MEQLSGAKQRKDAELAETQRTTASAMWEHELRALRDELEKANVKREEKEAAEEESGPNLREVKKKERRQKKEKEETKLQLVPEENSMKAQKIMDHDVIK